MGRKRAFIIFMLVISIVLPAAAVSAETSSYTYTYDYWGIGLESSDAYVPTQKLLGQELGMKEFINPQGLFIKNDLIYLCDSGNNRIVIMKYSDKKHEIINEFNSVIIEGGQSALKNPSDIFVNDNGDMYICDTDNQRILVLDKNMNFLNEILKPVDESIDSSFEFLPMKIVADKAKRIYVQAKNVNKGLMEFDKTGEFTGYVGANKVQVSLVDYFWKMIATQKQKSQMELFVPTEYNNVCIDEDGFMYVTTSTFEVNNIETAGPVRRLNSMGNDILIRNGWYPPIGDLWFEDVAGINGCSRFVDAAALANDSYCCLDRVRGRIFMYDFQGNLLYCFGGLGNNLGCFQYPVAVTNMGDALYVLDARDGSITRFELTEYGSLINSGINEYKKGNYDLSSEQWEKVLQLNGNYDLAFIGIGRSLLRKGEYKEAMYYFKAKKDFKNYSKAFQLYRKEWIEANIGYILLVIAALIILPKVVRGVIRFRKEVSLNETGSAH